MHARSVALCGLLATALSAPLFSPVATAQARIEDRVEAMMIAADRDLHSLPLVEERMQVTIDGQSAQTTLTQVYQHDADGQIEGKYSLRPGAGSHINGFAYWNGEQKIVGEVFERETAKRVYNEVVRKKRDPGLLEESGEGQFSFKVFPIQPHEKKRVELAWSKWLERHGQTVKFRAPITRPDAEIVIALDAPAKNVRSSTHRFRVEKTQTGVRLRAEGAKQAGSVEVEWDVDEPDWTPDVYVQPGIGAEEGWFTMSLAAPKMPASAVTAKDVTIVIDRSGSMDGDKMQHAKLAAADVVRLLHDQDRVNVISFSDEVDPMLRTPAPATAETRGSAIAFIDRLHAGGGTDIAAALRAAITTQATTHDRPHVVVFLTDGQSPADQAVVAASNDAADIRLFTLGLGQDVNRPLLSRLAAIKRGRFVYIENAQAIEPEVRRLANQIANPLLVDVSIDVQGPQPVRIYPRSLPDLFAEDELVVSGRLRGTGPATFIIKGKLDGKPMTFTRKVNVDGTRGPKRTWLGALWAQSRVVHLLEEIQLGGDKPEMKAEVIDLALAYNFVTPYTAFLAIPEGELGHMRTTVEAARDYKRKLRSENPDLDALDSGGKPGDMRMFAKSTSRKKTRGADASDDDDEKVTVADSAPEAANYTNAVQGKHGCAGCATGGATPGSLIVALVCVGLLRRRRR